MPLTFGFKDLLINFTMVQHYFNLQDIIAPSWTLLIELLIYFFMVLILISGGLNKVEFFLLPILALTLSYAVFLANPCPLYTFLKHNFPLINHFPLFMAGILFYRIKKEGETMFRIMLLLICYVSQIFLFKHGGSDKDFMSLTEFGILTGIYYSFFILLTAGKLTFINNAVTQFLGKISYSIYLIHLYHSTLLIAFFTNSHYFHFKFCPTALFIVLPYLFISSYLLYRFIELPGIMLTKALRARIF